MHRKVAYHGVMQNATCPSLWPPVPRNTQGQLKHVLCPLMDKGLSHQRSHPHGLKSFCEHPY